MDKANVPSLQLQKVQACRRAFVRWLARYVVSPTGPLRVLLAPLLLVYDASPGMSLPRSVSNPTSNDLLLNLASGRAKPRNYAIVAQNVDDIRDIQNAPAVSMGPYLLASSQDRLLTAISIYTLRGDSSEQARLLYMNATALRIWEEMGRIPKRLGSQFRPPREALLEFGVPFSE